MTNITPPVTDERGDDRHPSWALIGASRVSHGPHGAVLFDSDVRHQHYVSVKLSTASRKRTLHQDRAHADRRIIEVSMSEAQWASFVSSMNVGDGVPCTMTYRWGEGALPGMPYEPRLQESMDEVRDAAAKAQSAVKAAFNRYTDHKTAANLRSLEAAIKNMPSNITFAAESLSEHAENVVQKARADIEAIVVAKADQLGLEPGDLGLEPAQLVAGEPHIDAPWGVEE